jgi:hypothetical protein
MNPMNLMSIEGAACKFDRPAVIERNNPNICNNELLFTEYTGPRAIDATDGP